MLHIIENLLSADEVRQFREKLDKADWQDGTKTAGSLARKVKNNLQLDDASETAQTLRNLLLQRLGQHPHFMAAALPAKIFPPRFNRYEGGGNYGAHIDNAVMPVPGSNQLLRTDVSATVFLSAPEEYEGGELIIEDSYGSRSVKLRAGSMVLYPATSLHKVTPVTHGARIAAFFWIQSMVRDDAERTLLFELDTAIQQLTVTAPENPALVKFSGVYHNLVRRWADT